MFNGSLGPWEILLILGVVLLIFGPKRLPGLGRQLGRGLREFKDSVTGERSGEDDDERKPALTPAATPPEAPVAESPAAAPAPAAAAPAPAEPAPAERAERPAS